jgi:hypothetical protein
MSSIAISLIALVCVFGGALLGIVLRAVLPAQHLSTESKETVKIGTGLVATMTALVLGLLVASAQSSMAMQSTEVTDMSSKAVLLDRVLAHYGPETKEARDQLRSSIVRILDQFWSKGGTGAPQAAPATNAEALYDEVQGLSPKDEEQRSIQVEAVGLIVSLGQIRWLMYEQSGSSVSIPLLIVLIFWLTVVFVGFGLFAPSNATVVVTLFLAALSVSGAIFMILEMYTPYTGLIQISSVPLRAALAQLGR